jgi:hypothetical protein
MLVQMLKRILGLVLGLVLGLGLGLVLLQQQLVLALVPVVLPVLPGWQRRCTSLQMHCLTSNRIYHNARCSLPAVDSGIVTETPPSQSPPSSNALTLPQRCAVLWFFRLDCFVVLVVTISSFSFVRCWALKSACLQSKQSIALTSRRYGILTRDGPLVSLPY